MQDIKYKKTGKLNISIGDTPIKSVSSQTFSLYIDETLSWYPHIDCLCSIISSITSLLKQLSDDVPENIRKIFYQSYSLHVPMIDDGSNSWGSTSNTSIERVNKLRKRAARIILKADYTTPSEDMFQWLGWMPVAKRINYNKAVLTYKAMNNLTPSYIPDLLIPIALVCNRNLRSSENGSLILPKTRLIYIFSSKALEYVRYIS